MRLRAVLIGSTVTVILALLLVYGTQTIVQITGRPLVLDCGGLGPAACEAKMLEVGEMYENLGMGFFPSGPVTYFTFHSTSGGDCGDVHIERGIFTFGLYAFPYNPLCQ